MTERLAELIGQSMALIAARGLIDRLAGSDDAVLVTGPSGSGKTVVAELLHQRGPRAAKPFVAVDCASLPPDRLEHELFGHGAGAMPGATCARQGRIEAADGGTLFLDRVGTLPGDVQATLLHAIQTGFVQSVIGTTTISVDVRVIVAAAGDGRAPPTPGSFAAEVVRQRTAVEIALPPLAERRDDIPLLIDHFSAIEAERGCRPHFTPAAIEYLVRQAWPGNVRELRSFVARAAALHARSAIDDALAAVLLHGERRRIDHWLATAARPMPLPNRRRPSPIVAADEVSDVEALLRDLAPALAGSGVDQAFGALAAARLLGLRPTPALETMHRRPIGHPDRVAAP